MHYFLDGYNLLFRLCSPGIHDITAVRERLISHLDIHVTALDLNVTAVFDSHYSHSEESERHYRHLHVVFTDYGITADTWILSTLDARSSNKKAVVITSDKRLARAATHRGAQVEAVEIFFAWLSKRYSKYKQRKIFPPRLPVVKPPPVSLPPPAIDQQPEDCFSYYLMAFEAENNYFLAEEDKSKKEEVCKKMQQSGAKEKRKKREKAKTPESRWKNDEERWLELFEKHLEKGDGA